MNLIRPFARARAAAALLWLAAAVVPAPAGTAAPATASPLGPLPPGWTVAVTDVIAVFSPPSAEGSVTIVAPPALAAARDIKNAIVENAPSMIEDMFGEPRPAGDPVPLPASDSIAPGLLVPLIVELEDGAQAQIDAIGYPLSGGRMQLFFIAAPATMEEANASLQQARTLVDQWRAASIVVNENLSAGLAGPAAALQGEDDADPPAEPPATPPAINPDDTVENVLFYFRYAFNGDDPGASAEPAAVTALLLKDGRVFENEARAPAEFDPASRPPGSPGVGRWQRDGEAYALAFADGTQGTAVAGAAKTLPAPAAMSLVGHYAATGGIPGPMLPDTIEFYPDGSLLLKNEESSVSGTYAIAGRTLRVDVPGRPPASFIFGYVDNPSGTDFSPPSLVIGNRLYRAPETEKVDVSDGIVAK